MTSPSLLLEKMQQLIFFIRKGYCLPATLQIQDKTYWQILSRCKIQPRMNENTTVKGPLKHHSARSFFKNIFN